MGAYLSAPITEKISSDESNEFITCGASSMQGWRTSQEDAHNCTLDFDNKTSLFAVYDGHGGAEVALYCAEELPNFLKNLDEYKRGDFEEALKRAFIGFDATLIQDKVKIKLKNLIPKSSKTKFLCEEDEEDMDMEDLAELRQESHMPLIELLGKYKDGKKNFPIDEIKQNAEKEMKPVSPFLRGRRNRSESSEADSDGGGCGSSGLSAASLRASSSEAAASSNVKRKNSVEVASDDASVSNSMSGNEAASGSTIAINGGPTSTSGAGVNANATSATFIKPDSSSTQNPNANTTADGSDAIESSSGTSEATELDEKSSITNGGESAAGQSSAASLTSPSEKCQENEISTNSSSAAKMDSVSSSSSTALSAAAGKSSVDGSHSQISLENGEVSSNSSGNQTDAISQDSISSTNDCKTKINMPILSEDTSSEDEEEDASYNEDKSSTEDGEMESDEDDTEDDDDDDDDDDDEDEDDENDFQFQGAFLKNMVEGPGLSSGCTAVLALLVGRDLYVANAGDSRCVVCRNGRALEMSIDHKPEDVEELTRIRKAGGDVSIDGRVNGGLNLSRAIGDHAYKQNKTMEAEEQMISALPDIKKITISDDDEFMIIACDGIWNFMSSEEVVQFIKPKLAQKRAKISTICEELFMNCLSTHTLGDGTGCDNMTAVLIQFKPQILQIPPDIKPENRTTTTTTTAESSDETAEAVENITRKRSASTDSSPSEDQIDSVANQKKRLKTDTDTENGNHAEEMSSLECAPKVGTVEKLEKIGIVDVPSKSTLDEVSTAAAAAETVEASTT